MNDSRLRKKKNRIQHVRACSGPGRPWGNDTCTHSRTQDDKTRHSRHFFSKETGKKKLVTSHHTIAHFFQLLLPQVGQRRCVSFDVDTLNHCDSAMRQRRNSRCALKCMQRCNTGRTGSAACSVLGGVAALGGVSPEIKKCKFSLEFQFAIKGARASGGPALSRCEIGLMMS